LVALTVLRRRLAGAVIPSAASAHAALTSPPGRFFDFFHCRIFHIFLVVGLLGLQVGLELSLIFHFVCLSFFVLRICRPLLRRRGSVHGNAHPGEPLGTHFSARRIVGDKAGFVVAASANAAVGDFVAVVAEVMAGAFHRRK
jgi:hypothetical protein